MNVNILKNWMAQGLLLMQACVLKFLHHVWSALWTTVSLLLYPIQQKWRPAPFALDEKSADALERSKERQPAFKSGIQERLGMSYWCRWRPVLGVDTRVSVWHLYLPTLELYSQLLTGSREKLFGRWWQKHFASLGLDSGLTSFSMIGVLSLSGLRFKSLLKGKKKKKKKTIEDTLVERDLTSLRSLRETKTAKATLSTILLNDRDQYEDDEDFNDVRLKMVQK
ncbi:MAG: hypothetical protein SGARI_003616 [Bacillariaceae sp.]